MPKKLMDCVAKVKARHGNKVNPWAVCVASTGLKPEHKKGGGMKGHSGRGHTGRSPDHGSVHGK
jgi:hypothetical protein